MKVKNFKFPHTKIGEGTIIEANTYYTNHLRSVFKLVGTNMVDPGFKLTPQWFIIIFAIHSIVFAIVYMLFTDASISSKLEALCISAIICQGIHKLYTVALYPDNFTRVFDKIRKLHLAYSNNPELSQTIRKICVSCTVIVELLAVGFFGGLIAYFCLPIILWKKYGIFTTILPVQYPFIDWHTTFGYAINTVVHVYSLGFGLAAILAADGMFVFYVLHSIAYRKIFEWRINKLDNILLKPGPQDKVEIQNHLHQCIIAHQEYIKYIVMVDTVYCSWSLSQLATSELVLALSLILTLWSKWIVGPFVTFMGLFQILEYCTLGTVVTYQNDIIGDIFYGFRWYLMPVKQQKLVVLMILRAQNSPEMTVGGFAQLNVATCMSLLKTTYSLVMMVLKFLS